MFITIIIYNQRKNNFASVSSVLVAMVTGPLIWLWHQADSLPKPESAASQRGREERERERREKKEEVRSHHHEKCNY